MQIKGSTYQSILHCAKTVYTKEGLTAFYASYPTTLFMSIPFAAIQIAAYDSLSRVIRPRTAPPGNHIPTHLIAGGMAGALAAGLTTPLDCIKTVLQTRGTATDAEIRSVKGIAKAATIIKHRYGFQGFFRGSWPRIITAAPSTAICWWETPSVPSALAALPSKILLTLQQELLRTGQELFHQALQRLIALRIC